MRGLYHLYIKQTHIIIAKETVDPVVNFGIALCVRSLKERTDAKIYYMVDNFFARVRVKNLTTPIRRRVTP